jgi:hypothetical protein
MGVCDGRRPPHLTKRGGYQAGCSNSVAPGRRGDRARTVTLPELTPPSRRSLSPSPPRNVIARRAAAIWMKCGGNWMRRGSPRRKGGRKKFRVDRGRDAEASQQTFKRAFAQQGQSGWGEARLAWHTAVSTNATASGERHPGVFVYACLVTASNRQRTHASTAYLTGSVSVKLRELSIKPPTTKRYRAASMCSDRPVHPG